MAVSENCAVVKFYSDFGVKILSTMPNSSGEYQAECPNCGSMTLYINRNGLFNCHYCSAHDHDEFCGNPYTFLHKHREMKKAEALATLEKYGLRNKQPQGATQKPNVRIAGGYFVIARKILDADVWRGDPHILKLFLYLIGKARHSHEPKKYPGFEINRGELVTSIGDIIDCNQYMAHRGRVSKWSRSKVSRMLNKLKNAGRIEEIGDTYGLHIRISQYDLYQNPSNYVSQDDPAKF